jgi:hypothetical protein
MYFKVSVIALVSVLACSGAVADILDASDERQLTEADLSGMDGPTLRLARNEIFARHGYKFKSDDLTAYFSQFSWYNPVTKNVSMSAVEDFNVAMIKSYEDSAAMLARLQTPAIPTPNVAPANVTTQSAEPNLSVESQQTVVVVQSAEIPQDVQNEFDRLHGELEALTILLENQKATTATEDTTTRELAEAELNRLISLRTPLVVSFEQETNGKYQTPIRPTVDMLKLTVSQMSELWPKVPYYRPGTAEEGEFRLNTLVSDVGVLQYVLKFFDPQSSIQQIGELSFSTEEIGLVRAGLGKSIAAADTLKSKGVAKVYSKSMACFPEAMCAVKQEGNTSTEVIFRMNEDGATGVQLVRNKGKFPETYALSTQSAALLASYFDYIIDVGAKEFEAGSMTDSDIDALLKE